MNLPKSWMCKYCISCHFQLHLPFKKQKRKKKSSTRTAGYALITFLVFPTVTQTAWRSAFSPPMRNTSVTLLFRSTSLSSRLSALTMTSTWCVSMISTAWPTSWVQMKPASPKTHTAFLSRYVPTQLGAGSQWIIHASLPCLTFFACLVGVATFVTLNISLFYNYRALVQTHGKTLLWTSWVYSVRKGAVCMTGCPLSHSQSAEVTPPWSCFTWLWWWWKESQGAELQLGASCLSASHVWIKRLWL